MESKVATLKILANFCYLTWKDVYDKVDGGIIKQQVMCIAHLFLKNVFIEKV